MLWHPVPEPALWRRRAARWLDRRIGWDWGQYNWMGRNSWLPICRRRRRDMNRRRRSRVGRPPDAERRFTRIGWAGVRRHDRPTANHKATDRSITHQGDLLPALVGVIPKHAGDLDWYCSHTIVLLFCQRDFTGHDSQ